MENNKILAEFLGWLVMGCYVTPTEESITKLKLNSEFAPYVMKFHNDWNWIMLVVDKIENTRGKNGVYFDVAIDSTGCWIDLNLKTLIKIDTQGDRKMNKIQATYNACVDFVKWYNENFKQ